MLLVEGKLFRCFAPAIRTSLSNKKSVAYILEAYMVKPLIICLALFRKLNFSDVTLLTAPFHFLYKNNENRIRKYSQNLAMVYIP